MSASTNSGFSTRPSLEIGSPSVSVVRSGREWSAPCPLPSVTLLGSVLVRFALSLAVGVAHTAIDDRCKLPELSRACGPPFCPSEALGVGHSFDAIANGTPAPFPFTPFAFSSSWRARHVDGSSASLLTRASGVGHIRIASVSVVPGLPYS